MVDLGHFFLFTSWGLSIYSLIFGSIFAVKFSRTKNSKYLAYISSTINSLRASAILCFLALIFLGVYFLKQDYRYFYVWRTSNKAMPFYYKISAIWGGMDGSMLLWAALLSVFVFFASFKLKKLEQNFSNFLVPTLSSSLVFFLSVVCFLTNPFRFIPGNNIPITGRGLNPLLQNPSMVIHPPFLYLGFTGLFIPAAFSLAALLSNNLSPSWIQVSRRFTLVAWSFLTAGIILGGHWAYIELGWGGFWAWDPVENASFLPWLTATAFLHSVIVQEKRAMLKVWNFCLCFFTYLLTVFGTFLTRSGVVQSVHAFAESDIGVFFLYYIAISFFIFIFALLLRIKDLKSKNTIESWFSKESAFLFNNLILISICFATFWGVMFPIISEFLSSKKSVVGPPFFNKVNVPLFLLLLILMGVGPVISWKKTSLKVWAKMFLKPLIFGSLIFLLFISLDSSRIYTAMSFGLISFVFFTIISEVYRAVRVRKKLLENTKEKLSLSRVFLKTPRRWAGLLVHLGILIMGVGITASMAYKQEKDILLKQGEEVSIGSYTIKLISLISEDLKDYSRLLANVDIKDLNSGKKIKSLSPERRFYFASEETTTEVAMRVSLLEDFYLALSGLDISEETPRFVSLDQQKAIFKVYINPLQVWLWFGGVIVMLGSIVLIALPQEIKFR